MQSAGLVPQHHRPRDFWPHVTLGYVNRRIERQAVLDALGDEKATATTRVQQVTLAAVSRRHGHYQWDARAEIALDGARARRRQPALTGAPSRTGSDSTP
jgi:2'-5' RNA ligase